MASRTLAGLTPTILTGVVKADITTACNQDPLRFCAGTKVTKAQMATFIFRALDWWQLNTVAESSRVPDGIFLTEYNEFSWYVKTQGD